jgi:amino acid transporter
MSLRRLLFGRPLRSGEQEAEKIGPLRGVPLLGLDALASASYGPEAALTVLLGLGATSARYLGPIMGVVIAVLFLVFLSYRQVMAAYPGGGGSYAVARENLGPRAGLVAASALAIDYILNSAVAISAGVGAIISAVPGLQPHTLALSLLILVAMTVVNLRGVREAGLVFMLPTYAFVGLLGGTLVLGAARAVQAGGNPVPVVPPPTHAAVLAGASLWLLLHAFASGCTSMTGVEAVSNDIPVFGEPMVRNAQRTLTAIVVILVALLVGIVYLANAYHIAATVPGRAGYQSVLSQLTAAVVGRGVFYYATLSAVVAVLCFSANTSFAGFPRLCRVLALDQYLPAEFAYLGRRLVYTQGVVVLALLTGVLLIIFGGVTDRLIPLFAVGVFLAFTMAQWGMVIHWRRKKSDRGSGRRALLNAVGALATGATLIVVLVSKFTEGAWLTVLAVPSFFGLFSMIHGNYGRIEEETEVSGPMQLDAPPPPLVVIPLKRLDRVARKSIRLAISMSPDVQVVQVRAGEPNTDDLQAEWRKNVEEPLAAAGYSPPRLVVLHSEYREFLGPVVRHVQKLARENSRRYVAVVIPEVVQRKWYHFLLHSHRPALLKTYLFLRGGPRVIVINTPWYLSEGDESDDQNPTSASHPAAALESF